MAGFKTPRRFTRNDTSDIQASNLEQNLYQISLSTDIIDARAFGGLDDVTIAPSIEQMINAAIQYAAAVGASRVFVPKSMAGYDFNLIVNNPVVTLIKEGYDTFNNVFNIRDYGASTSATAAVNDIAIQKACNAASNAGGGLVVGPPGRFKYNSFSIPANVTVQGAGRGATVFVRSGYGSGTGNQPLFGIRLTGNFAGLCHCSTEGLWNPANPTVQTFDANIGIYGDNVKHTTVFNVETYNAHLGYIIGGIIGDAAASWGGQDYNEVVMCYAHDTYDLGFALVAKNRTTGVNIGCRVVDCKQLNSYATGGLEVRYQIGAQVLGFSGKDNTNSSLGCAVRLEETTGALLTNIRSENTYHGIQHINDSMDCVVSGYVAKGGTYGASYRNCANMQLNNVNITETLDDAVTLLWTDGLTGTWTKRNENITIDGGIIDGSLQSSYACGVNTPQTSTEAAFVNHAKGLKVRNLHIKNIYAHGVVYTGYGNHAFTDLTLEDCGFGLVATSNDGTGILLIQPTVNGVNQPANPDNGLIDDITFITSGAMTRTINDNTGGAGTTGVNGKRFTHVGLCRFVGTFVQYPDTDGTGFKIQNLVFADSPYTATRLDRTVRCTATGGAMTVNLPAAGLVIGMTLTVKKTETSANAVTVDGNGAETIDGSATFVLAGGARGSVMIQSNGTSWDIL